MTTKAERLAWELIGLSERYSPKDFERASELLQSGQLFQHATAAALDAKKAASFSRTRSGAPKGRRQRKISLDAPVSEDERLPIQMEINGLLESAEGPDRERLIAFAARFQNRDILRTSLSARGFAEQIGVDLPLKTPSRGMLLKLILEALRTLPQEPRDKWLMEADRSGSSESSLQRWSDLIVKG